MRPISLQEVTAALTGDGFLPLACSFAVSGVIYRWGPKSRLIALRIEDNDLYEACMNYLYEEGREFSSLDEAVATAKRDNWPHWERLPGAQKNNHRPPAFLRLIIDGKEEINLAKFPELANGIHATGPGKTIVGNILIID